MPVLKDNPELEVGADPAVDAEITSIPFNKLKNFKQEIANRRP
jgi:hypothetical protein